MTSPDIENARSLFLKGQRNEAIALLSVGEGSEDAPARLHSQFGDSCSLKAAKERPCRPFRGLLKKIPAITFPF